MKGLGMKKMMNIFKNIFEYFNMDNRKNRNELRSRQQDDFETKYGQYKFLISSDTAYEIACQNENLKTDYCRANRKSYSYIGFRDKRIDLVEIDQRLYWKIQILDCDISGIDFEKGETVFWDGFVPDKDLYKLKCLIDVETGEYIYYPRKDKKIRGTRF